jgi:hypothetical protein
MKSKRIILHLHNSQIVQFIRNLPRGYRSLVVESALAAYMKTDAGQALMNQLEYRKDKGKSTTGNRQDKVEDVLDKLKGDFD